MSFRYLSHILSDGDPVYGGHAELGALKVRSIANGDSCNAYRFYIETHWGTHIDLPYHFFEKGAGVCDMQPDFWFFRKPCIVEVMLEPSQLLLCGRWIEEIDPASDIVLLRSGWSARRHAEEYIFRNPGIHPKVGARLRNHCGALRAVGLDWLSASPYQDRCVGRESHRALLDPEGPGAPIAIIEDMDLSGDLKGLRELYVAALRVRDADSAPCTVIGRWDD